MDAIPKRQTVTFIVRVWAEYLAEQPPRWYGMVEMVGNPQKSHFSRLNEIVDFIQEQSTTRNGMEDQK